MTTLDKDTSHVARTGAYVQTEDHCDASRFKDQLRVTLQQFPGVKNIVITSNGFALADVQLRKSDHHGFSLNYRVSRLSKKGSPWVACSLVARGMYLSAT